MKKLRLGAISMTSRADKSVNVDTALSMVQQAVDQGCDWIQLPEIFPYHGPYSANFDNAEEEGGPLFQSLSDLAKSNKVVLFAGTVNERPTADEIKATGAQNKVYNTSYTFGRDGELLAKYRKVHLFNLITDDPKTSYCESDGFLAGSEAITTQIDGLNVGFSICYDLRFPQFYNTLAQKLLPDVIVVPSAFTLGTGRLHWEVLLRARAIEHQCFVFASNQTGTHREGKSSFGHSMIIDPMGKVLANTGEEPGIAMTDIDVSAIEQTRSSIPSLANRRPELYS